MSVYEYVSKKTAAPPKRNLVFLFKKVQMEVKQYFTFRFDFIGSSSRNMITREVNGNIGYDFDVNIEPNDPEEKFSAEQIRCIIFEALRKHMGKYGYSKIENSTSVITIKAVDKENSRIEHSCDIAIVYNCNDGRQQYIRCYKEWQRLSFRWEYRDKDYYMGEKLQWIKENGLNQKLRDQYLINKSRNNNPDKHSRTIFAETVNNIYNEYAYRYRYR